MSQPFVRMGINFNLCQHVLTHTGEEMPAKGVVYESYPQALVEREATFPAGIAPERHAVAIPHCEAVHAISPAIYLTCPDTPVNFQQADDDGEIAVSLTIALIVENLTVQLKLLCRSFSELQNPSITEALPNAPDTELAVLFRKKTLESEPCAQA